MTAEEAQAFTEEMARRVIDDTASSMERGEPEMGLIDCFGPDLQNIILRTALRRAVTPPIHPEEFPHEVTLADAFKAGAREFSASILTDDLLEQAVTEYIARNATTIH